MKYPAFAPDSCAASSVLRAEAGGGGDAGEEATAAPPRLTGQVSFTSIQRRNAKARVAVVRL